MCQSQRPTQVNTATHTTVGKQKLKIKKKKKRKRNESNRTVAADQIVLPRRRIESVEGLVSIDRSVVAALLSTTPRA